MNYVLILINYFPDYIKLVINSILNVDSDANIILCNNQNKFIQHENIFNVDLNDLNSDLLNEFNKLEVFKKSIYEENPLWITSVQRIFYLNEVISSLELSNVIHFDNDVIIYKPFKEIESLFSTNKINITPYNENKFTFGYSYLKNNLISLKLANKVMHAYENGKKCNWDFNNGKPLNEMEMISKIHNENPDMFNLLPTLPYQNNIIFDPAGYGQFLDGTHYKPKKFWTSGYTSSNDPIGVEIKSKRLKVRFENNPKVFWEKNVYPLVNLHIHSKRIQKYLPQNLNSYI